MSRYNIEFKDGWYGRVKKTKNGKIFCPCGKITELVELCEDIQTDKVYLKLECNYLGKNKTVYIERGELTSPSTAEFLANMGFDVTKKDFDAFVDSILVQEDSLDEQGIAPTPVYTNLGWIDLKDENGNKMLCYRADELIGAQEGKYIGNFDVRRRGTFEGWKQMIEKEVLGRNVLQILVIAGLAAPVNGLISPYTNSENGIVHVNYASGQGKTTGTYASCSVSGAPFEGVITEVDDGIFREYISLHQSWGATDNAVITSQAGNRGVVTILSELGKNFSNNMARVIFDLSEGSDKKRLTTTLKQRVSERYTTVFVSTGEESLIGKVSKKLEGIAVRVLELKEKITDNAEHSNRIKEGCRENCGHAAPMLAKYIIDHGGVDYVLPMYKRWLKSLRDEFPNTPSCDRFIEKFAALFMTTAELSIEALGVPFDLEQIKEFLRKHEEKYGNDRNVALSSYKKIVEECRVHTNNFYRPCSEAPTGKVYGRFCNRKKKLPDGKQAVGEVLVRKIFLEEMLDKHGFPNIDTCKEAWDKEGVLNRDNDRFTRSREIEPNEPLEDVFCFWLFESEENSEKEENERLRATSKLAKKSKMTELLSDEEVNENEADIPDAHTA